MTHTLSDAQWQRLQGLFEQAELLDSNAITALLDTARESDPVVADALAAMLAAHVNWNSRTAEAVGHLSATMEVSSVGARLGAYRLVSEIGRGGMGVVYLGERMDGQVQQQVAIKVLHTHSLDVHTRARFQRERDILAGFEHAGIARLLDAGESAAGEPYFVMEYLRGATITAHCDALRLGIRARLHLFLQICDAVQYAHGQLILHRDIKPSNVLVDSSGVPRLIDFGIAKPLRDGIGVHVEDTHVAHRFFSPVNAAPEQIRGEPVAVSCDVYQLGTLLYELLCGKPLFDLHGKSAAQIEEQICEAPPRAPSDAAAAGEVDAARARNLPHNTALQRALRGDLNAITLRALRKEPASRYRSVEQFSDDVKRYLGNLPVHGRRGSTLYRLQRFSQRNWRALAITTAAVVGLLVSAGLLIRQQQRVELERDNAVTERHRGEAVTDFLVDIFRVAGPSSTSGPDISVRAALKKGEQLLDQRADLDPRARARLLATLSTINVDLSNLDAAKAQALRAIEVLELHKDSDPLLLADQYQQASGVLMMMSNLDQAREMADKAVQLYRLSHAGVLKSWYAQLISLRVQRDSGDERACAGVESLLQEARTVVDTTSEPFAMVLRFAVDCRMKSADGLARSVVELQDAIARVSAQFDPNDQMVLQLKRRLALVFTAQEHPDQAMAVFQDILTQQEKIYGVESWAVALTLGGMANIAYQRHDYAEAEKSLLRAQAIFQIVHKDRASADIAETAYALARVRDFGHHDSAKAAEYYALALDIVRKIYGSHAIELGWYAANYGALLQRSGETVKAESLLREAIGILPPSDHNAARARVALASICMTRGEAAQATELFNAATAGIAEVQREDPSAADGIRQLRTYVETSANPATH
ncbi:MAG: serine/threonine-protein kinase [Tahibacter sp.]